jgi:hypothetical protein
MLINMSTFGVFAASLSNSQIGALEKREILYLLAVGQFRAAEYARSRRLVDQALKVGYVATCRWIDCSFQAYKEV